MQQQHSAAEPMPTESAGDSSRLGHMLRMNDTHASGQLVAKH